MTKTTTAVLLLAMAGLMAPRGTAGQETEDHRAIRALLDREQAGWEKGDGTQINSCYAKGYVGYSVPRANGAPNFLATTIGEQWLDGNREKLLLAPDFVGAKEALADTALALERHYEMSHIHVDGTEGVAVATFAISWTDTLTSRRVNVGWQSLWLLRKIAGEWKYVGSVGGISSFLEEVPVP